jgi:hypothetical protein
LHDAAHPFAASKMELNTGPAALLVEVVCSTMCTSKDLRFLSQLRKKLVDEDSFYQAAWNEKLAAAIETMASSDEAMREIIVFCDKEEKEERRFTDSEWIEGEINWHFYGANEFGTKRHHLHAHVIIQINHKTSVHLSRSEIQSYLINNLELNDPEKKKVWVSIKALKGAGLLSMIQYVEKESWNSSGIYSTCSLWKSSSNPSTFSTGVSIALSG